MKWTRGAPWFAWQAAVLSLLGCSTSNEKVVASEPTPLQACSDLATFRCQKLAGCEPLGETVRYGNDQTCLDRETLACMNALSAPGTGNTPRNVEGCLVAYAGYECADFMNSNPPAACRAPSGTVAVGQPCQFPAQCQTGYCALPRGAECGTCAALPVAGDSCASGASCGYNLVCSNLTQKCVAWGTVGDPCDKRDGTCGYGFGCATTTSGTAGTCQLLSVAAGQPCGETANAVCDTGAGLFCTGGTCQTATLSTAGGPCGALPADAGAAAAHGYCMGSSRCDTAAAPAVCTGPAADNGACDTAEERIACMPPARCVGTASDGGVVGTCQVPTGMCTAGP